MSVVLCSAVVLCKLSLSFISSTTSPTKDRMAESLLQTFAKVDLIKDAGFASPVSPMTQLVRSKNLFQ